MMLINLETLYIKFTFYLMQVIVEIPFVLTQTTYFTLIVYAMLSFQWTAAKFLWFFYITLCSFLYFTYYGMMTVSISSNHQVASILASTFNSLFNLFSGFFLPRPVSFLFYLVDKCVCHNIYVRCWSEFLLIIKISYPYNIRCLHFFIILCRSCSLFSKCIPLS